MRKIINLNKNWEFALCRGFGKAAKADAVRLNYTSVNLPHDWVISSPFNRNMEQGEAQGFRDRWGTGWYKKTIEIPEIEQKIYKLCFDGIYENSTIWVNDIPVGGRKYGYSSFSIDITAALRAGENHILVKVDNTSVPVDRWYSGAGIYRQVYLQILPEVHLVWEEIQLHTEIDGDKGILDLDAGAGKIFRACLEKGDENIASVVGERCLRVEVPDCILWSAENPELYHLRLELLNSENGVEDQIEMKVGFRNIALSAETGLYINGNPVKLKGVCIHQEAGCFGTAVNKEIWKERLLKLKAIGCNSVRPAHHIFMPEILELCDEIGLYVYEECFDKWTGGAYGRYYQTEWKNDLSCMVKRDRNHPCILFWGVGNEVENQAYDSMLTMLERHVKTVKELDDTRYVSLAMNPHFAYPAKEVDMSTVKDIQQFVDDMKTGEISDMDDRVERIKYIAEKVDFISCNYQEQWYDKIHKAIPDKAILGTETYMYFRGYEENFQNFSDQNPWWDVEEREYCIGGMIWTGIDYLGESMGYPAKGWSGALFSTDMEMRPIAWLYQSYWSETPMVHFAVMDYSISDEGVKEHWDYPRYVSHWEFPQFHKTVVPYMIATNCEEVRLLVNEREFFIKPVQEFPNRMVTGFIPYLPGTLTVIGKNGGKEVCRQVLNTPGMAVKLAFEQKETVISLKAEEGAQGDYEVIPFQQLLKVRAYDRSDHAVFRESAKVWFKVEGPARIVGVDNGDMQSAESFNQEFIHLYCGRANVALSIYGAGRIRVTAFASGMEMAQTIVVAGKA